MADIVSAAVAVTSAVLKLGKVLYNQANFLLGVKDGVEQLQSELRWMKSFLNDAETKIDNNNLIRQWVSDVQDLAYEAEDVIDTFLLKFGPETQSFTCGHCISFTKNAPTTHKLGHELEKLREKSIEISSRPHRYGLNADVSSSRKSDEKLKELRASTPYANNDYMVGLAETVSILKAKLTDVRSGRSVISIVGMGGLGKTTLARKLYNELRPSQFSYHAWVCVSQEYDTEDILRQVIKSMGNPTDRERREVLANKGSMEVYLRNKLSGSSFLVVIDDVWDEKAWESLERAFPDDCAKGRVIITTRYTHVAERHSGYVHQLRDLNKDESWELFCKETFKYDTTMQCPSNLEKLGREMVAKCSGSPLALVTLGGILSTKPRISTEWEWVNLNLWKELKKNSIHVDAVLALSFKELPDNLKLCFLYVGLFPEDFEIPIRKLMLLWESEGFFIGCEEEEQASPEDIAKSYFNELVGRNLLQKTGEDWIKSSCRVHDLVRDLAIKQAEEIKFCAFYGERQKNESLKVPSQRKLAMHLSMQNMPTDFGNRSLRTLHLDLWEGEDYRSEFSVPVNKLLQSLHRKFHLLRVLDIHTSDRMPHLQVDKLINLRYLSLKFGEPFKLPETLGHLKELQTLYVSSWDCVKLPKSLGQLRCLKHLRGKFRCRSGGIGKLTGLETLEIADYETWCCLPLETLVRLRHLSLKLLDGDIFPEFLSKFGSLKRLQKLVLKMCLTPDFLEIFKHCPNITHFQTCGSFNFPGLSVVAANLQVIELLEDSDDFSDTMSELQRLHVLRALRLSVQIFHTVHLVCVCSDVGFPQLRTLHIKFVDCGGRVAHVEFSVAEGGLPVLTNLHVDEPDKVIAPDRLKQLISAAS